MTSLGLVSPNRWLVVCDGFEATVYRVRGWRFEKTMWRSINPEGRCYESQLTSDRPGLTSTPLGFGNHHIDQKRVHKDASKIRFAKRIIEHLLDAYGRDAYDRLVLVAPPKVMGFLRQTLPTTLSDVVEKEITKDLTHCSPVELVDIARRAENAIKPPKVK